MKSDNEYDVRIEVGLFVKLLPGRYWTGRHRNTTSEVPFTPEAVRQIEAPSTQSAVHSHKGAAVVARLLTTVDRTRSGCKIYINNTRSCTVFYIS